MSLELLQQWVYGNLDSMNGTNDLDAANIVRIIVAGNSVRSSLEVRQRSNQMRQPESTTTLKSVTAVDDIISNWIRSVNVDVMSGEFDPSNFMLPQQPMHHCMFPKCADNCNFRGVTNPYECRLSDRQIIGTSGQNVDDIMRFSRITDPIEALRSCLVWSHITPTSPDTLPCFPYYERDPFVLSECPHVLFAGNSDEFKTDMHIGTQGQRTRLVCVPSFSQTRSVAVVNLRTLDCKLLNFHVAEFDDIEE